MSSVGWNKSSQFRHEPIVTPMPEPRKALFRPTGTAMTSGGDALSARVSNTTQENRGLVQAVPFDPARPNTASATAQENKDLVQAVPFDPTRPNASSASPSDLHASNTGLAEIVDAASIAKIERKLPPVFKVAKIERKLPPVYNLKQSKAAPKQSLIVLAPQHLARPSEAEEELESDTDVKPAPTAVASSPPALGTQSVSTSRQNSVVELAEPMRLPSGTDIAASQPTETTQPQPPAATPHEPIIQFTVESALAASVQPGATSADDPLPSTQPPANEGDVANEVTAEEIEAIDDGLRPINRVMASVAPKAGDMPRDYASARFAREGEVAHRMGVSRETAESLVMWEAPAVCYRALYFEDVNLERHGHKVPFVQPMLSAAHFFGRAPLLPYMAITERSRECGYSLGHYRPGDYAPYSLYIPRPRLEAGAVGATAILGVVLAFP